MTTSCTLTIQRTANGFLLHVNGRGTMRESPAVKAFARQAMSNGEAIVLDLERCEYLDSTFLGCLLILHEHAEEQPERSFQLYASDDTRKRLLHAVRLDRILSYAESLPETCNEAVSLEITDLNKKELCQHLLETHRQLGKLEGAVAEPFRRIADQLAQELEGESP